ncbi:MAG TPA: hypothetical protein VJP80_02460 [Candidatus Saccharimonadales bacterium]|nr:hypothetical protein [Candidatus Saccharimonadales bacterium]
MGLLTAFTSLANASAASDSIHSYVVPTLTVLTAIATAATVFITAYAGYLYITSSANPEHLTHAKRVLRNGIIGLFIVMSAAAMTALLNHAYTTPAPGATTALPALQEIQPQSASGGWSEILIDAITGFFASIVTSIASPVLNLLEKLTSTTPLMSTQASVFNLWRIILVIANGLFALVLVLLGFRVMSAELLGLDEVDLRSMVPQILLIFGVMNGSIFAIDAVIGLNNAIITAIHAGFPDTTVWGALASSMARLSGLPLVSLILFVVFVILAVMLVVYYIGRLLVLFLGAALSPFVILLWLLPGFRDFANNLIRTYLMVVFVLIVHVVILLLAAALLDGLAKTSPTGIPNPFMAVTVGIATILALLRTQGVLVQMSIVSSGTNATRKLGKQFAGGVSYTMNKANQYAANQLEGMRAKYLINVLGAAK